MQEITNDDGQGRTGGSWAVVVTAMLLAGCQSGTGPTGHTVEPLMPGSKSSTASASGGVRAKVTATVDGDTFRADVDGRSQRVRVLGINAPEVRHGEDPEQCGGEAARTALDRMIWRHTVTLSTGPGSARADQYGRLLRYVSLDGRDVGLAMIEKGRASEYHPRSVSAESREHVYSAAQRTAEQAKLGQWAVCARSQETKR